MKFGIFIALISLSLLSVSDAYCCWGGYGSTPAEYYTFRVCDDAGEQDKQLQNCVLWQRETSSKIPLNDIQWAVYKFSHDDLESVAQLMDTPDAPDAKHSLMQNQFVAWIVKHRDREILDFLLLAKFCEETRHKMSSPWYYPVDGDDVSVVLNKIAEMAKVYNGNRLRERYALQAVRAMLATYQYEELINYWNDRKESLSDGLMKEMIMPYVAGAYYRTGAVERAKRIYAEYGDIKSLIFCEGKKMDEVEQIKLAYEYAPDSPALAEILQRIVRRYEYEGDGLDKLHSLYDFALKVIAEGKVDNVAMWYYTAGYLADAKADPQTAASFLTKATAARGTQFIKESARVLQIYVDAKIYPYDAAYEQKLLGQLQWLDGKIAHNINEEIIKKTMQSFDMRANLSYYYWNDMMRKITLSVLVPRYIQQGNHIRAIQFANMADHRLQNLVDKTSQGDDHFAKRRASTIDWNYDYSTDVFALVDSIGVDHVIAYTQQLKRPRDRFDKFLNDRGYTNQIYFDEIAGTLCLRAMRYADAVKYLERVPSSFQYTLNVWKEHWMKRDPFVFKIPYPRIADRSDYKLRFAKEMLSLEQSIKNTADSNRKAQAQIRYAVGIYNSVYEAWALTQYRYGGHEGSYWQGMREQDRKKIAAKSRRLIAEALVMFTDAESAAQSYLYLGSGKQIMQLYPTTQTAEILKGHCDNLADYSHRWK